MGRERGKAEHLNQACGEEEGKRKRKKTFREKEHMCIVLKKKKEVGRQSRNKEKFRAHSAASMKARGALVGLQMSWYGWNPEQMVVKVIPSTMICTLVVCQAPH